MGLRAEKADKTVTLHLKGVVGLHFNGQSVSAALRDAGEVDTVKVRLDSPGGIVWDGFAIYNALHQHPARVEIDIDALAASAASVIAMAADEIRIAEAAMMMIHDPWSCTCGSANDLRAEAGLLDKITGSIAGVYTARTGIKRDAVLKMMADETWLDAQEAVDQGFADSVTKNKSAPKNEGPSNVIPFPFRNAPSARLEELGYRLEDAPALRAAAAAGRSTSTSINRFDIEINAKAFEKALDQIAVVLNEPVTITCRALALEAIDARLDSLGLSRSELEIVRGLVRADLTRVRKDAASKSPVAASDGQRKSHIGDFLRK